MPQLSGNFVRANHPLGTYERPQLFPIKRRPVGIHENDPAFGMAVAVLFALPLWVTIIAIVRTLS